jgi:nucleoside-diphosphate-sugar epimerase
LKASFLQEWACMEIRKPIVLITGCSGFIGNALARRLSAECQVVGLDRDEPKNRLPGVAYFHMDISSESSISGALDAVRGRFGEEVDSVIHLAAYYSFSGKESPAYEAITVRGTENFIASLKKRFSLGQFVFSSTMLVHEPSRPGWEVTERSPVSPSWAYPESKIQAEKVIEAKRNSVPTVNLRIAGVYDDHCHSIPLAQHISRVFERQVSSIFFPGDASHGQCFLHLDDLVSAVVSVVSRREELPAKLNLLLGEDEPLTYRDLQAEIGAALHGLSWPTFRIPASFAKLGAFLLSHTPFVREPFIKPWMIDYADEHYDLDITRARIMLGWEPQNSLRRSIPRMAEALLADPEGWYREHKIGKPKLRALEPVDWGRERAFTGLSFLSLLLGLWLLTSPATFGYGGLAAWNDIAVGGLIALVSALTLAPTLRWLRWINAGLAVWLLLSPLAFWTPSAAIYGNSTLLGGLILFLAAFTPSRLKEGPAEADLPPGWSYNPSGWTQRLPIMTLAFLGFLMARYLGAFQLGHTSAAWDPFFGPGTELILTSDVSRAFPVADAALGAFAYLLDVVAAALGDRGRWRTMPWAVMLFGLLIIPAGVTSIVLVMLQPIAVGQWCTICLAAAMVMLVMVPQALDEVVASVHHLVRSRRAGLSFWRTLWFGGGAEALEGRAIPAGSMARPHYPAALPPHLILATGLGLWLLFAPWFFGLSGAPANNLYVVGALVTTISVIAFSEIGRLVRLVNVPVGLWLVLSAFLLEGMSTSGRWHSVAVGALVAVISLFRGPIVESYGTLNRWARWTPFERLEGKAEVEEAPLDRAA